MHGQVTVAEQDELLTGSWKTGCYIWVSALHSDLIIQVAGLIRQVADLIRQVLCNVYSIIYYMRSHVKDTCKYAL